MFHLGKLGWRNPRPNDFNTTDLRPLRDMFGNLQQFMTWPHFTMNIDVQSVTTTYARLTNVASDDPYQLIDPTTNIIRVPSTFDKWMFVGWTGVQMDPDATVGRHLLGWGLNNATLNDVIGEVWNNSGALSVRVQCSVLLPVRNGDFLDVRAAAPATKDVSVGRAHGYFLPMA